MSDQLIDDTMPEVPEGWDASKNPNPAYCPQCGFLSRVCRCVPRYVPPEGRKPQAWSPRTSGSLTFEELKNANFSRGRRWHKGGLDEWSVAQWAVAMAGEAGEICNAVKKLDRIEDGIANLSEPVGSFRRVGKLSPPSVRRLLTP